MTLKHSFVSPVTDGGDTELVGPDEWNGDHVLNGTDGGLLYNSSTSVTTAGKLHYELVGGVGHFTIGNEVAETNFLHALSNPTLQLLDTSINAGLGIARYTSGNSNGGRFQFAKSRGGTILSQGIVQNNDTLGYFSWQGSDGTQFVEAAAFYSQVDGTPGSEDMPGRIVFATTPDGSAGPTERAKIDSAGNIVTNMGGALATNATDGFLFIPTCAGTPTGVPTSYSGQAPMVYDTTNNKLYIYNGAWKASGAFT